MKNVWEYVGIGLSYVELRSLVETIYLLHSFFFNLIVFVPLDVSRFDDIVPDTFDGYAKFEDEIDRIQQFDNQPDCDGRNMVIKDYTWEPISAIVAVIDEVVDNDGKDDDIDPHGYWCFSHLRYDLVCLGMIVLYLKQDRERDPEYSIDN